MANIHSGKKNYLITYPHCNLSIDELMDALKEKQNENFKILYMIVCHETHQDGEPHLHAFFNLEKPFRLGRQDMHFFDVGSFHPNIEHIRSPKDAIKYVKKGGEYSTFGICPFKDQLTRKEQNELLQSKSLCSLVDEGIISLYQIPSIKRALDILRMEKQNKLPAQKPIVHWFFGATGTGKSKAANEQAITKYGDDNVWRCCFDGTWYDGYTGEPAVILDDIRPSSFKFDTLLKLCDRYKLCVPIKGGFTRWMPREIWITAPAEPRNLYRNYQTQEPYEGIDQLERRIDECLLFTRTGDSYSTESVTLEGQEN